MHPSTRSTAAALAFCFSVLTTAATPAYAASISLTGSLDANDANDALLITFALASGASVEMQSFGFGGSANAAGGTNAVGDAIPAGGFDTYFSLFAGAGSTATFLQSNDDGSCPPGDDTVACRDSSLNLNLPSGSYVLSVSVFNNFSFAENLGSGTLGDGFIGLGSYFNLDIFGETSSAYAVDIVADGLTLLDVRRLSDSPPTNVPEPGTLSLLAVAVAAVAAGRQRARSGARRRPAIGARMAMSATIGCSGSPTTILLRRR